MFRKANINDIDGILRIYDEIHSQIETEKLGVGWVRNIYPTKKTAENSILKGHMFVGEDNGKIIASAIINQEQGSEYLEVKWDYDVEAKRVMVLHTLVVSPNMYGKGYGSKFVEFYEQYALEAGCRYFRMDTNEKNLNARRLYKKLGYKEVGIVSTTFNGIEGVQLVLLEKKLL